jgi:hypothetical protein
MLHIYKKNTFLFVAYRLEYDNSWVSINDIKKTDERKAIIGQVMNKQLAIKDALNP